MWPGSGGGGLPSRQPIRTSVSSSTVMPIDLCSCTGAISAAPFSVLKYQARPMLVRISSAISQCRAIATDE